MSRLVERYPQVRHMSLVDGSNHDQGRVLPEIEPYLEWQLVEIDVLSLDILLAAPSQNGNGSQPQTMVILSGRLAGNWLYHVASTRANQAALSEPNPDGDLSGE